MRGEFIGVWAEMWRGVWAKLAKHSSAPPDLFSELYREMATSFIVVPDANEIAEIVDRPISARAAFARTKSTMFRGELAILEFLEKAYIVATDLGDDTLSNRYFLLMDVFIEKFSLRYDLRRPFTIHPTLPGVFARMVRDLKVATSQDSGLHPLMLEFEDAIRDLRSDRSPGKIKSCIQKQINLLEAIGQRSPGVTRNTLGRICDQVGTWPHAKVKEAMQSLYGFACDYPGIRHGGTMANQLRDIEMRDLVSVSVLLAGFYPYLTNLIDSNHVYRGT